MVTTTLAVAGGGPKTTAPPPATVPEVGLTLPAVGAMVQVLFKTLLVGEVVPMPDSDSVINGMRSSGTEFFFVRFEDGELWKIVVGKHRYTELPCDGSPTAKKSQKVKLPSPRPKKRCRNNELTSPPAACGSDMAAACRESHAATELESDRLPHAVEPYTIGTNITAAFRKHVCNENDSIVSVVMGSDARNQPETAVWADTAGQELAESRDCPVGARRYG